MQKPDCGRLRSKWSRESGGNSFIKSRWQKEEREWELRSPLLPWTICINSLKCLPKDQAFIDWIISHHNCSACSWQPWSLPTSWVMLPRSCHFPCLLSPSQVKLGQGRPIQRITVYYKEMSTFKNATLHIWWHSLAKLLCQIWDTECVINVGRKCY